MKRAIISLLSVAAVVASCTKSRTELPLPTPTAKSLTVEKARVLVEKTRASSKSSAGEDSTIMPRNYTPQWRDAREEANAIMEAVEIPIITNKNLFAVDNDGHRLTVHQRVLVADGQNFRNAARYMMTLIADSDYGGDLWSIEHAGDRRGFTGIILYHSLSTGQFVKVNRLENGQSVDQLYVYKYSDEHVKLLRTEIDRVMCGVRMFQSTFATKSGDDPAYNIDIDEVVIIGDRGNGGDGGFGGPGKDDTSGNNNNEDDQQCPDGDGGGGGWTPPSIPQAPLTFTQTMAQYALDRILKDGKVNISSVTDGMFGKEINRTNLIMNGRRIFVYNFNLGFGDISTNYALSSLSDGHYVPAANADGERWFMDIYNQNGGVVGSITIGIGDRDFVQQTFFNAQKK